MCYYIRTEGNNPCYLIRYFIWTRWKNIGNYKEYVNNDTKYAPQLEEMELGFLNTSRQPKNEYNKYYPTPSKGVDPGEIGYIASYKKLYWRSPLGVSQGFTQYILKFCFHIWDPIWCFKKSKSPLNPQQPGMWLGFVDSTG